MNFDVNLHITKYGVYYKLSSLSMNSIIEIVKLTYPLAAACKDIHVVFGGSKRDEWTIKDLKTEEAYSATTYTEVEAWRSALKRVVENIWQ